MKFEITKKWLVIFVVSVLVFVVVGVLTYRSLTGGEPLSLLSPWGGEVVKEEPRIFDKYSFPALANREFTGSKIKLEKVLKKGENFTSWVFSYFSDGRRITGMVNAPRDSDSDSDGLPVVILVRGFVPDEIYETGAGSQPMADFLASNGFITLAPDFLGFGGSDTPPAIGFLSPLADRFEKPAAILNLLASLKSLDEVDLNNVFFWGHSNGGQVVLSVLEITKKPIPTVLWAPVTKPFPYNVLYFVDETDDKGKYLRKLVSEFEKDYDSDFFSIHKYFGDIAAPIQLHQGKADQEVPIWWSDEFYGLMKGLGKEIEYFTYEGAGHNMTGAWQQAAERSLGFYREFLVD